MATTLAAQDFSQLKKDYGAEQADVITGIIGNIISGQVTGDTAKTLSENFGKIVQDKNSMTINSNDTSTTKATQLDYAIPTSKIAALSSGEFFGIMADNPDQKIKLKIFHSEIQNNLEAIKTEVEQYKPIPDFAKVTDEDVQENYKKIKREISELIEKELTLINARQVLEEAVRQPLEEPKKEEENPTPPKTTRLCQCRGLEQFFANWAIASLGKLINLLYLIILCSTRNIDKNLSYRIFACITQQKCSKQKSNANPHNLMDTYRCDNQTAHKGTQSDACIGKGYVKTRCDFSGFRRYVGCSDLVDQKTAGMYQSP